MLPRGPCVNAHGYGVHPSHPIPCRLRPGCAGLTQRFKDVEEEVFNALRHLIADTSVLKQYAAASLIVYKVRVRMHARARAHWGGGWEGGGGGISCVHGWCRS